MIRWSTSTLWVLVAGVIAAGCDAGGDVRYDARARTDAAVVDTVVEPMDVTMTEPDVTEPGEDVEVPVEVDGGGIYDDVPVAADVTTGCNTDTCTPRARGCTSREECDDGVDNDCDGQIDEGCVCVPGAVQRCFRGPPGYRNVGACQDGQQTCQGVEIGSWGPCMGGAAPSGEACDGLDNDCNGCADEGLCCTVQGTCPAPGDPRIPTGRPFTNVVVDGADFLAGARSYRWTVEGGPCDQLLWSTRRRVTYKLNSSANDTTAATGQRLTLAPTLSGDYSVALTAVRTDGSELKCSFIVPVRANGLRVETCWDTTGNDDVDLWLHRPVTADTRSWTSWPPLSSAPGDTCYYFNCKNAEPALPWGYSSTTTAGACPDPNAGACHNPRLDVDNQNTAGVPENINVDAPRPGDRFRIAVNYYRRFSGTGDIHPMVNVYCGGALRATYGGANIAGVGAIGAAPVTGFNTPGNDSSGSLWRVADVVMQSANSCTLAPLHRTGTTAGYCVATGGDRTYNGSCTP